MNCRNCKSFLDSCILDLGASPPSNAYLTEAQLNGTETYYPLRLLVCKNCWLVQTQDFADREKLFNDDYAYFSSVSESWVKHAEKYVHDMTARFGLNSSSLVIEIAANDGYLLQHLKKNGIPCLGIEPTKSTADAARSKGIEIIQDYFGRELGETLANSGRSADLVLANNVLAHVPDINDFVSGVCRILKPDGIATFEFPHLLQMILKSEFDTVYHEHYSYLSFLSVSKIFENNGLHVFDVEELPTHGGSLRLFAQIKDSGKHPESGSVNIILQKEISYGMNTMDFYKRLQPEAERIKFELLDFLVGAKKQGKTVAGYGAAAKGNTLLNFAGVKSDLLPFICDAAPSKQGKFMPGSRIPIYAPDYLREEKPNYIIILPWNIKDEIIRQLSYAKDFAARFVITTPKLEVYN